MADAVLNPWLNGGSTLDLSRAPLRLLALVNRLDLRDVSDGKAGEGRFVFGVLDPQGFPTPFTIILEYRLPAASEAQVLEWANLWHELGALDLGSAAYNTKLAQITERFAGRNAEPGRVNGSALSQLRSNEIALSGPWELREFVLSPANGLLRPDTVKLTPDSSFMDQNIVATFINQNQAAIIAERHDVPNTFNGVPFLGGSSLNTLGAWNAPGINSNEARHKFSLNTCNGCHGSAETGTVFLHINPRSAGEEATLSGFLTGIDVNDPVVTSTVRHLDDLERRAVDMEALLCSTPSASARPARRCAGHRARDVASGGRAGRLPRRMAPIVPDAKKIKAFRSEAAFEAWLHAHHAAETEVWLRIYKKGSGVPTVTPAQAIDVALCWGWIDGIRKGLDELSFLQRFTPRRTRSIWSQINRDNVARLIAAGRMTPHGQRQVDLAKADGRWDAAYAPMRSASADTLPEDLRAAIEASPRALATLRGLGRQNLFALVFRINAMKTPAGRAKKIAALVAMLGRGETIVPESSAPRKRAVPRASRGTK